ncbi:MAG TPA: hypothetical protein VFK78_08460 [Gemmatimonadales bacterium]|nr:hypothetical protein [Gemmatimonadales bacterium]
MLRCLNLGPEARAVQFAFTFSGARLDGFERWFRRAPFAVLAAAGLAPLLFWPFKALAFAAKYPLDRYLAAVALRPSRALS